MMRWFILSLLLGIFTLPSLALSFYVDQFPDSKYATLKKASLNGPVHTVRTFDKKGGRLIDDLTFDRAGRLMHEVYYQWNNGNKLWTHDYFYNAQGWMVKAISSSLCNFSSEPGTRLLFKYDAQGHLLELLNATHHTKDVMNYDPHGQKVRETSYLTDHKTHAFVQASFETMKYDEHGNIVEWVRGDPKHPRDFVETTTYAYAPDGHILREERVRKDGTRYFRVFSPQGKLLEEMLVPYVGRNYQTGEFSHTRYRYDEQGHQLESARYDEKDALSYRILYGYRKDGKLLDETTCDSSEEMRSSTEHRYNAAGLEESRDCFIYTHENQRKIPEVHWTFKYNAWGKKIKQVENNKSWTYDSYGNNVTKPADADIDEETKPFIHYDNMIGYSDPVSYREIKYYGAE